MSISYPLLQNLLYSIRGGQLGMKDPDVLEAISKADELCEMIKVCQRNAVTNSAANREP